jgi:osmoprotectant transport system substrate-binding protein
MIRSTLPSPARRSTTRRALSRSLAAIAIVATTTLAACGSDDDTSADKASTPVAAAAGITKNADNASKTVTVGSKNFTEQQVLGEVYAQALEAAGYTVKREFNLGDEKTALKALKGGQIDGYPEYTGTALGSFFNVSGDKVPKDENDAYELLKSKFEAEGDGIVALTPTPFTSSNEVAVTKETAAKYNLTNISDLQKVAPQLTLYGSPECRSRLDCLKGLEDVYGLQFKKFTPVDVSLRHEVLDNKKADVSIVFTTDPENARGDVVLLKDDKGMFPPYNPTFLTTQKAIDEFGPDYVKTIELVNTKLDDKVIQELNAKKDLDKDTAAVAAQSYLSQFGFVQQ